MDGSTWGEKINANFSEIDTLIVTEWQRCRPWIEAALIRGGDTYKIEDVEQILCKGRALFWPGKGCAAVTEFIGRNDSVLNFWLVGGDLKELVGEMRPFIEQWAKDRGCTKAIGSFSGTRKGWGRVLENLGYSPASTTLVKDL